jgi:hypothetical protein
MQHLATALLPCSQLDPLQSKKASTITFHLQQRSAAHLLKVENGLMQ